MYKDVWYCNECGAENSNIDLFESQLCYCCLNYNNHINIKKGDL